MQLLKLKFDPSFILACRLNREFQRLQQSPPTGVTLGLPVDTDLYTWEATIDGPEESVYKG